jgi:ribosomal subunit interface protein
MRYQISGKQIDVGEALQTHVKAEMGEVVEKYAQRPTECVVVFSRVAHEFVCEAVIHLSTGLTAQAKGHASEIYAAFESCREKLDKQLRRYKRRIRNHHSNRPGPVEFGGASSYILAANEDTEEAEPDSLQPVVIAEMETKIPSITVGEAVMQMELAGQRMLVFRNEGHGGVNVVYRRDDGNIGWIDPSQQQVTRSGCDAGTYVRHMELSKLLVPGAVRVVGQFTSKKRLFQELGEIASQAYGLSGAAAIDGLQERESLGPTGVGHGIALPHARLEDLKGIIGVFLRLEKPLGL